MDEINGRMRFSLYAASHRTVLNVEPNEPALIGRNAIRSLSRLCAADEGKKLFAMRVAEIRGLISAAFAGPNIVRE